MSRLMDSGFPGYQGSLLYAYSKLHTTINQPSDTGADKAIGGKGYPCKGIVRRRLMQHDANVCLHSFCVLPRGSRTRSVCPRAKYSRIDYYEQCPLKTDYRLLRGATADTSALCVITIVDNIQYALSECFLQFASSFPSLLFLTTYYV
jgi:hypothetical protein